jgi:hypothetical protein
MVFIKISAKSNNTCFGVARVQTFEILASTKVDITSEKLSFEIIWDIFFSELSL